jgi:hypothetical protein
MLFANLLLENMFEWREREHELEDKIALSDPNTIEALRNCILEKFFRISTMRAQVPILEYLMKMWDPDEQVFKVGFHDISIEIEDIYFLTRLSR